MIPIRKCIPNPLRPLFEPFLRKNLSRSQAGQDYWIYAEAFNEKKGGYFVDIGAHDGIVFSNTYLLESKYHWSGICIEANPLSFDKLYVNRSATCLNVCLDRSEGEVNFALREVSGGIVDHDVDNTEQNTCKAEIVKLKTTSLNTLLLDQQAPGVIDYLSIDIEGAEERVLAGFDFHRYLFKCMTIERPSQLLRDILRNNNYMFIREIPGLDCLYVHQTFLKEYTNNLINFYLKKHIAVRWQ